MMAPKSVIEKAESMAGGINKRNVLNTNEVFEIYEKTSGFNEATAVRFRYGYMQGMKAVKAEMKVK